MSVADRALLAALADEAAQARARLDGVAGMVSDLIRRAAPEDRQAALTGAQAVDVLGQRLEAIAMVLQGLARGEDANRLIDAVTLSDMAARLRADAPASDRADGRTAAGDLLLFE